MGDTQGKDVDKDKENQGEEEAAENIEMAENESEGVNQGGCLTDEQSKAMTNEEANPSTSATPERNIEDENAKMEIVDEVTSPNKKKQKKKSNTKESKTTKQSDEDKENGIKSGVQGQNKENHKKQPEAEVEIEDETVQATESRKRKKDKKKKQKSKKKQKKKDAAGQQQERVDNEIIEEEQNQKQKSKTINENEEFGKKTEIPDKTVQSNDLVNEIADQVSKLEGASADPSILGTGASILAGGGVAYSGVKITEEFIGLVENGETSTAVMVEAFEENTVEMIFKKTPEKKVQFAVRKEKPILTRSQSDPTFKRPPLQITTDFLETKEEEENDKEKGDATVVDHAKDAFDKTTSTIDGVKSTYDKGLASFAKVQGVGQSLGVNIPGTSDLAKKIGLVSGGAAVAKAAAPAAATAAGTAAKAASSAGVLGSLAGTVGSIGSATATKAASLVSIIALGASIVAVLGLINNSIKQQQDIKLSRPGFIGYFYTGDYYRNKTGRYIPDIEEFGSGYFQGNIFGSRVQPPPVQPPPNMQRPPKEITYVENTTCPRMSYAFPRDDQISDYIRFPRSFVPGMIAGTACLWAEPTEVAQSVLMSYATPQNDNEYTMRYLSDTLLRVWLGGIKFDVEIPSVAKSNLNHVCSSFSSNRDTVRVYINGKRVWSDVYDGNYLEGGGDLLLGQEQDSFNAQRRDANQAFSGNIYNFLLWPRQLTGDEILNVVEECDCPAGFADVNANQTIRTFGRAHIGDINRCPTGRAST